MRAFHSNTLLWPTQERIGQTQVEGGSPLIWTTLHPPLADTRLQTYAWNGHLANYMPWTIDQATDRPPIISHARWNIRRSTSPLAMPNPLQGSTHNHQATPENSTLQSSGELQPYESSAKAQSTQWPAPDPPLQGWTAKKTPGFTGPVPHPNSSAPFPKPQPPATMRNNLVPLAIMIYILLVQHSNNTGPAAQLSNSPATRHWRYSRLRLALVVKTRKSCSQRTMAIIQRLWDTAWDLTTHQNVESVPLGLACP